MEMNFKCGVCVYVSISGGETLISKKTVKIPLILEKGKVRCIYGNYQCALPHGLTVLQFDADSAVCVCVCPGITKA